MWWWRGTALVCAISAASSAATAPGAVVAWRAAAAGGAALEVYADDSYALLAPGGAPWLASAPTAVHVGGAWFSSASANWSGSVRAPLPLVRLGAGASADGGYEIRYSANGTTPVTTSFALDAATGAFVFTQSFPLGATGVATLVPLNSSAGAGALGEFASSTTPATQFPAFAQAAGADAAGLGFVSWAGRFFSSLGAGSGGAASAFDAAAGGAEGGPIVLFAGGSGAAGDALVLSPLDNFKGTMLGRAASGAAGQAAAGVSGYASSLPANFSTSTVALFGAAGVTDAVRAWGAALLARHGGGAKVEDPTSSQLTYWTDS